METSQYWLLKTEPSVFSFQDLLRAPRKRTLWEGVRNYRARNFLRDDLKVGHEVLIYHSNIEEPEIAGLAKVVRENLPDPTALDPKSRYCDPKAIQSGKNPWVVVEIEAVRPFLTPVTRTQLKGEAALKDLLVLKKGMRLSVLPLTPKEFQRICKLGG